MPGTTIEVEVDGWAGRPTTKSPFFLTKPQPRSSKIGTGRRFFT